MGLYACAWAEQDIENPSAGLVYLEVLKNWAYRGVTAKQFTRLSL